MVPKKHRLRGYPARRPTVDELLATRERMNRVSADFLKTDLNTALTFAKIARETDNEVRRKRNCYAARKAYETVVKVLTRIDLKVEELVDVKRGLDQLKGELEALGETF